MGQRDRNRRKAPALLATCAAALCLALIPATASAATHPFLAASSLDGSTTPAGELDKPCGAATDSAGDLYVANSAKGEIDVFTSAGVYLTRILDPHAPCGLAVDPEGNVYALDTETGDVALFAPEGGAYPPGSGEAYLSAVPVDESGEARGIAVNSAATGAAQQRLYVSKGSRIDSLGREVQQVSVGATGGTFKLSFEGQETAPLPYDATAAEVQAALQGLSGIGAGNATVTLAGSTYTILFSGALAYAEVPQVKAIAALTRNETQEVRIRATAGTFKLTFEGQQTGPIPYNATAAELKGALEALSNIGPGDVSVGGGPGDSSGSSPYLVTFEGVWANTDVGQMSLDSSALSGGSGASYVQTPAPGTARLIASTASSGGIGAGERQQISLRGTASGTYKLVFEGDETASLAPGAPPGSVEAALEALPAIGAGNVSVSGAPGGPYTVSFEGALAATDVPQIEARTTLTPSETQKVGITATGGTFKLSFEGQQTAAIPFNASAAQLKSALEALSNIEAGDVSVTGGPGDSTGSSPYLVSFEGAWAGIQVREMSLDSSELTGPLVPPSFTASVTPGALSLSTTVAGWSGRIGEGVLSEAAGIGVWGANGNVYAAEESGVVYVLDPTGTKVRAEITGAGRPGGEYTALPEANIAVDQGNGHVYVSDVAEEGVVDEYEGAGAFVSQTSHSFQNAEPTALAVDPTEGESAHRLYVTSGAGAGGHVYAFGALPTPTHAELPATSLPASLPDPKPTYKEVTGLAVDSQGDLYVASSGTSTIYVYEPQGEGWRLATTISNNRNAIYLAVDSEGDLYAAQNSPKESLKVTVEYRLGSSYPFEGTTPTYEAPVTVDDPPGAATPNGIAVDPANDHLFVSHGNEILEYDSAAHDSALLHEGIGKGLLSGAKGIAVDGRTGEIFVSNEKSPSRGVVGIDPQANEQLVLIDGSNAVSKKPDGAWTGGFAASLAVDQSNRHVYVTKEGEAQDTYEFEADGAYVSRLNRSVTTFGYPGLAVDNSGGLHDRDLFASAGLSTEGTTVDAYGPAEYGEAPAVRTTGLSNPNGAAGTVTVQGTANPNGFEVAECRFEYVSEEEFEASGFSGAPSTPCAESAEEIGEGFTPVEVHADLSGLDSSKSYRYRLLAANGFGESTGEEKLFGPPAVSAEHLQELLYTEAILAAQVDPRGLDTHYRCEYGTSASHGSSSAEATLAGEGAAQAECPLFGLAQGTAYHYRFVATNAWGTASGEDRRFTTLTEGGSGSCPNVQFRNGTSSSLPDCRAYELVTPSTGGVLPFDLREPSSRSHAFWGPLASPDGEDLAYYAEGAHLAGGEGNGFKDGFRAHRTATGWSNSYAGPNGVQMPAATSGGFDTSHGYSFWSSTASGTLAGHSTYLRSPDGSFEPIGIGQGSSTDTVADGRWISPGGEHVTFTSRVQLAPGAPPAGTEAVYDRPASGTAQLISTPPSGTSPEVIQEFDEENAVYVGTSADGSTVAFEVGPTLYLHRSGQTSAVAEAPLAFGGLSADGTKLFYVALPAPLPEAPVRRGEVLRYDAATETTTPVGSGGESVLVNASADGSHAYFASPQALAAGAEAGKQNLYAWSASGSLAFIGVLDDEDLETTGHAAHSLGFWVQGVSTKQDPLVGFARTGDRSTPDGSAFAFVSKANFTSYDSEGHAEVYLYLSGEGTICVSCNPGHAASADAALEAAPGPPPVSALSVIPNLSRSEGHTTLFFESLEGLVPQDRNGERDVYEWRDGVLSLISAGTGTQPSYLFGASEDGRDVFFVTSETLLGADRDGGAPSVYDARIGGGFPEAAESAPCNGEECRSGGIVAAPTLAGPASGQSGSGNVKAAANKRRCPKGRRSVKRHGKRRCVAKRHKRRHAKHHRRHRSKHARRARSHEQGRGR